MNVERRLQHAARELREVPITVPPLGRPAERTRPRRYVSATPMLIPLLFVAGALFAIGAARPGVHVTTQSDIPAASGQVDAPSDDPAIAGDGGVQEPGDIASKAAVGAPSVLDELQIIAALVETRPAVDAPTPAPKPATEQGRRPANIFGPI